MPLKKPLKKASNTKAAKASPKKTAAHGSVAFAKTHKPVKPMRERPLSPHLGIYRWQITMTLSILHRATGIALYIGAFVLAALIISLGYGEECFNCLTTLLENPIALFVVYGFLFCLFYHLCNGIRHLVWDVGSGFDLRVVTFSGVLVTITSLSLTFAVWLIIHPEFIAQFQQ